MSRYDMEDVIGLLNDEQKSKLVDAIERVNQQAIEIFQLSPETSTNKVDTPTNIVDPPTCDLATNLQHDCKLDTDLISRQAAIDAIEKTFCNPCKERGDDHNEVRCRACNFDDAIIQIDAVPSAQPEPLTDKEQRIFLAAMGREEKVCEQVDDNRARICHEKVDDSLVKTCREIVRKVKGALWTF